MAQHVHPMSHGILCMSSPGTRWRENMQHLRPGLIVSAVIVIIPLYPRFVLLIPNMMGWNMYFLSNMAIFGYIWWISAGYDFGFCVSPGLDTRGQIFLIWNALHRASSCQNLAITGKGLVQLDTQREVSLMVTQKQRMQTNIFLQSQFSRKYLSRTRIFELPTWRLYAFGFPLNGALFGLILLWRSTWCVLLYWHTQRIGLYIGHLNKTKRDTVNQRDPKTYHALV